MASRIPANQTEAFEMVEVRFILSMSDEERANNERVFSHIEQAWWFYEDAICDNYRHVPHIRKFEPFARQFVQWSAAFSPADKLAFEDNYRSYREYQHRIPVHGAALLTRDLKKVLLVNGFGSHTWGFPKGKINQHEDAVDCALREVYEETGFPALEYFNGKRDYEWMHWKHRTNGKDMRLLIVPDVPEDFAFQPRVVKEIADIRWFCIADLPMHEKAGVVVVVAGGGGSNKKEKLWGVSSFLPQLKEWIGKRQGGGGDAPLISLVTPQKTTGGKRKQQQQHASVMGTTTTPAKTTTPTPTPKQQKPQSKQAPATTPTPRTPVRENEEEEEYEETSPATLLAPIRTGAFFSVDLARLRFAMRNFQEAH